MWNKIADGDPVFWDEDETRAFLLQYFGKSDDDTDVEGFEPGDILDNAEIITNLNSQLTIKQIICSPVVTFLCLLY